MERALGDMVRTEDGLRRVSLDTTIIEPDEWRRVVAAIEARTKGNARHLRHADRPLLDGIAVCVNCGGLLRRASTRGYLNYACGNAANSRCSHPSTIAAPSLDKYVISEFLAALGDIPRLRPEQIDDGSSSAQLIEVRAEILDTAAEFATAPPSRLGDLAQRMTALRDTEARLLADMEEAPVYALVPTGMTWAQTWASVGDDVVARRALLDECIAHVVVHRPASRAHRGTAADRVKVAWE